MTHEQLRTGKRIGGVVVCAPGDVGLTREHPQDGASAPAYAKGQPCHVDRFLTVLKPRPSKLPKRWVELFRSGSVPQGDASAYPDYEELLGQMSAQREELTAWFGSMGAEQLARPLPEDLRSFAESYGVLMSTLAWHEGVHAGQLTVIRKDLGLEPMFR